MITKEQAFSIIRKEKPNHKITVAYEFPDKFAFVVIPKDANPDTFTGTGTYVMKKNGKIAYGMPTVTEMEHAIKIDDELKHHGVRGQKWGKRNGPPYPLNAEGKADLRKQRMASYGSSTTKGSGGSEGGGDSSSKKSTDTSTGKKIANAIKNYVHDVNEGKKQAMRERRTREFEEFKAKREAEEKAKAEAEEKAKQELEEMKAKAIREGDLETVKANRDKFTDAEITAAITRNRINSDLDTLTTKHVKTGAEKVDSLIRGIGKATDLATTTINAYNVVAKVSTSLGMDMPVLDGQRPRDDTNIADKKTKEQLQSMIDNAGKYSAKDISNIQSALKNLTDAENYVRSDRNKTISAQEAFVNPEKYTKEELENAVKREQHIQSIIEATNAKQLKAEQDADYYAQIYKAAKDPQTLWFENDGGTYVRKNYDMSHSYDKYELYHHGVRGQKWGKKNGPPYPLNSKGKAKLRKQRMASYGSSTTKGSGGSEGGDIVRGKRKMNYSEKENYKMHKQYNKQRAKAAVKRDVAIAMVGGGAVGAITGGPLGMLIGGIGSGLATTALSSAVNAGRNIYSNSKYKKMMLSDPDFLIKQEAGRKLIEQAKDRAHDPSLNEESSKVNKEVQSYDKPVEAATKSMKNWEEASRKLGDSASPRIKEELNAKDRMVNAASKTGYKVDVARTGPSGFEFEKNGRTVFIETGNKDPEKALNSLKDNNTDQSEYIYIDSSGKRRKTR